jgi:hypothetical protein
MIAIFRQENAFDSVQRPSANPNPLSGFKKGMGAPGSCLLENRSDALDLFIRDRQSHAPDSDKAKHAVHAMNHRPVLLIQRAAHEYVAAK